VSDDLGTDYVTVADLAPYGLTSEDVRRGCPHAVEYTALDGSACWLAQDLSELLNREGGEPS
jgi:hypothetical protein